MPPIPVYTHTRTKATAAGYKLHELPGFRAHPSASDHQLGTSALSLEGKESEFAVHA